MQLVTRNCLKFKTFQSPDHLTQNRFNVPAERLEINSEDNRFGKIRENSISELTREHLNDEPTDQAYDRNVKMFF